MSLRGKIFVFILFLSVLPLLIVGIISFRSLRSVFQDQVYLENKEISAVAGNKIEQLLDQCMNDLLTVHLLIEDRMSNNPDRSFSEIFRDESDPILEVVRSIVIRTSPFLRIRIIDRDGKELMRFTRFDEISPLHSAAGDPFFFPSISADMQYPPWKDTEAERTYTTFTCWTRSNETLHGLVAFDLDVEAFSNILIDKAAEAAGDYFLFDGSGRVISHAALPASPVSGGEEKLYQDFIARYRQNPIFDFITATTMIAGTQLFLSTIPVREHISFKNPTLEDRWYLGLVRGATPLAAAFDRSQRIFFSVLIFCVLLALVVSIYASRWITAPIKSLTEAAGNFAKGNLHQSVVVNRSDEIGELAASLNNMAHDIKTLMHERQVNETLVTIGRISAALAHDLKNPIEGLKLLSHELRKRIAPGSVEFELVDTIEHSVKRLSSLVTNTLDFTRLREPSRIKTNIVQLIDEVLSDFDFRHVEIKREYPAASPEAEIDPGQIRRVISNLVKNAFEATYPLPPDRLPLITMRVKVTASSVGIEIADNGPGISAGLTEKIFEPFFTTKTTGHGLGLAFVKQIIANHHGTITCSNEAENGTRFTILIPIERTTGIINSAEIRDIRRENISGE